MRKYGSLLIIDDEPDICEVLQEIFTDTFDKVITCTNAQQALGVTKAVELSAIITDINMPELPGDQLVRQLRAAGNLTPIMYHTAYANKELILSALRLGVSDVFEKPFDSEFLLARVHRVLDIEARKRNLFKLAADKKLTTSEEYMNEKKLLGLLHVVNESKKAS